MIIYNIQQTNRKVSKQTANSACNSNPCGAHGTCETLPVGYKCKCQAGYEGRHCETGMKGYRGDLYSSPYSQ